MDNSTVKGFLLLEDGTLFRGRLFGSKRLTVAEVVFTTVMTGYQEIFTDPSCVGQIMVMTSPLIGNYGVNPEDQESDRAQVAGIVCCELSQTHSSWRATASLRDWIIESGIPALTEVDTRRLTKHLRSAGVMRGVIGAGEEPGAEARAALQNCPPMLGLDLASGVSTRKPYAWGNAQAPYHVVAYDYGIKRNILRLFESADCRVTVVPANTSARDALALKPDGFFLSNGPGDPAALQSQLPIIADLVESEVPIFGICLGHQLLGIHFGGRTVKMPYGHRGGNHPVKNLLSGKVLITSQNHGFAVAGSEAGVEGAPELEVTHINLNDGSLEGLRHRTLPIFAVQYHPEAAPGPHDAVPLFVQFIEAMKSGRGKVGQALD